MDSEGVGRHDIQRREEDEIIGKDSELNRVSWSCEDALLRVCVCVKEVYSISGMTLLISNTEAQKGSGVVISTMPRMPLCTHTDEFSSG